ncbi:MAG: ribosome maturation factor RimP [Sporomusaceae bacterium]|nr:ribosome maturation factor RimP [Sporomusaceae bacterium]
MANARVEALVESLVVEIIQGRDMEVVDVEYVKERDWFLRVYLDKPGGVELEDCQFVSEQLENKLDELDPIPESYYLEVSSPGLDRQLRKERDFVRHKGDKVTVHTFAPLDGQKSFDGILLGLEDGCILLDLDGERRSFPKDKVSQVRLYIEF